MHHIRPQTPASIAEGCWYDPHRYLRGKNVMSKKTNNLRKRLTVQAEQHASRERKLVQREQAITIAACEQNRRAQQLEKRTAATVRVDRDCGPRGDEYQARVSFYPQMIVHSFLRANGVANVSAEAARVAHEVARMVQRVIVESVATK